MWTETCRCGEAFSTSLAGPGAHGQQRGTGAAGGDTETPCELRVPQHIAWGLHHHHGGSVYNCWPC